jgi:hypothetical protein
MTTDYIDIIKEFHDIAQGRELPKQAREILSKNHQRYLGQRCKKQKKRNDNPRKRRELLEGRFTLTKAVYVEREDDRDAIFSKAFDFSRITIDDLLQKGYDSGEDAYDKAAKRQKPAAEHRPRFKRSG